MRTFASALEKYAEIAQLVEHNLAKVRVASSSLVFRSKNTKSGSSSDDLCFGKHLPDEVSIICSRPLKRRLFYFQIAGVCGNDARGLRALLQENCSRYPLFSRYQEQFRYVFALGRLLLEKFRMGAKADEFDNIRVFIEPDQQGVTFNMAFHTVFVVAHKFMWFVLLGNCNVLLQIA